MYEIQLYQKSVDSILNLKFESSRQDCYKGKLLDIAGKLEAEFSLDDSELKIDLRKLPANVYIFQVYNSDGSLVTLKMLFNKTLSFNELKECFSIISE